MAEFCKSCFLSKVAPKLPKSSDIIMSDMDAYCEGCGTYNKFVVYIKDSDTDPISRGDDDRENTCTASRSSGLR